MPIIFPSAIKRPISTEFSRVFNRRGQVKGATLIEVLVTLLVAGIGVLGAASLQMNAVKFNHLANTRSYASILAYDVSDRMRANRDDALAGRYDLAMTANPPSGAAIYAVDIREWLTELSTALPGGDGSIGRTGNVFTIEVNWDESRVSASRESQSDHIGRFVFITEL
jgi:type IV pilus assembly protein PilV